MKTLTIYSTKFDSNENMANDGLSGKAFLDDSEKGQGIAFISIDNAIEYIIGNNIPIDRIDINYLSSDGIQMFKKFNVAE